jgi:hypothetical protein
VPFLLSSIRHDSKYFMNVAVRCRTKGKRTPLTEISLPSSSANAQDKDVSVDADNLPLHLQETAAVVGGVSEFERGLAIIANRKKDEETRKKAKEAHLIAKENAPVEPIKGQTAKAKRKRVGGGKGKNPRASAK